MKFFNFYMKTKRKHNVKKSYKIRRALVSIMRVLDTTDGKSRVIKIGNKYFRVRELG